MSEKIIENLAKELIPIIVGDSIKVLANKPYAFVHDSFFVEISGQKGRIVWDFLIYNELTFETESGQKFSLFTSISDEETQQKFDELKQKYKI